MPDTTSEPHTIMAAPMPLRDPVTVAGLQDDGVPVVEVTRLPRRDEVRLYVTIESHGSFELWLAIRSSTRTEVC